jgi:hypothetical protein
MTGVQGSINKVHEAVIDEPLKTFSLSQGDEAVANVTVRIRQILLRGYGELTVHAYGNYIIAMTNGSSTDDYYAREHARCLDRYAITYKERFGMAYPEEFITIFLTTNDGQMRRLAEGLYGITIPGDVAAVSNSADFTMVANISGVAGGFCGTLAHELFHLLVRSNFGDCPAWLEEGLASAYAVSPPNRFEYSNWRGDILKAHWRTRTALSEVLDVGWPSFFSPEEVTTTPFDRIAVLNATTCYFVMYLDHLGKLNEIYALVKKEDIQDANVTQDDVKTIVVRSLGKSLPSIQVDFDRWCNTVLHIYGERAHTDNGR